MLKLGVSEKYLKYLQVIRGSLVLILVLGLLGNTDVVLEYSISINIKEPSITCKYFKYFSETPSFNIRQLLSILLLKSARRDKVINELQISTKESHSFESLISCTTTQRRDQ